MLRSGRTFLMKELDDLWDVMKPLYVIEENARLLGIESDVSREIAILESQYISMLDELPPKAYMIGKRWKDLRNKVLEMRGARCQKCGKEILKRANMHHTTYEYIGRWHLEISTVEVLCPPCHSSLSAIGPYQTFGVGANEIKERRYECQQFIENVAVLW